MAGSEGGRGCFVRDVEAGVGRISFAGCNERAPAPQRAGMINVLVLVVLVLRLPEGEEEGSGA